jgi:predicted metalloprotease
MRLDEERESSNYEIQSGAGRGGGFGGGGGLFNLLLWLVASRFGLGGVVVLVIAAALMNGGFGLLGGGGTGAGESGSGYSSEGFQPPASPGAPAQDARLSALQHLSLRVLGSTERVWGEVYARAGRRYQPTVLSF